MANIFSFSLTENGYPECQLRTFLSFLISRGEGTTPHFAFASAEGSLLPNLTLRENIYLDSVPSSFADSKEAQLQNLIQKTGNKHLLEFYRSISTLDVLASKVDHQNRKATTLVKVFLQNANYLLFDRPEKYLEQKNIDYFVNILEFYKKFSNKTILLAGKRNDLWKSHITAWVYKLPNRSFKLCSTSKENLLYLKKAETDSTPGILNFKHLPGKKAA